MYGEFCHLELKLSGCNEEVAALHSDHYTQVRQYKKSQINKQPNSIFFKVHAAAVHGSSLAMS